jgi:hypothetical protein
VVFEQSTLTEGMIKTPYRKSKEKVSDERG